MTKGLLLFYLLLLSGFAQAQTISTDPVGFIQVTAKGNSDTYLSVPLHRDAIFQGQLASVNGSVLTVSGAAFTSGQFTGTHYALIASGAKEGMWYAITDTGTSTITIDPAGDTLGTAIAAGTRIKIIPFWTLDSLFPDGTGIKPSPTLLPQSSILIPDHSRAGINLSVAQSYFYYSGTQFGGEGWRRFGNAPTEKFDSLALVPDSYVIVRHRSAGDTTITVPGSVQMTSLATVIGTLAANRAQDNAIAFNVAVPTSLSGSGLYQSGAFTGSSTIDVPADQLLVFDNTTAQINKSPSAVYYYFTGSGNGGPGWRLKGDLTTIQDSALVFQPASGYILRKAASANPGTSVWSVRPGYVAP
jgi:uncharacterized protein (TIGR02597 family)